MNGNPVTNQKKKLVLCAALLLSGLSVYILYGLLRQPQAELRSVSLEEKEAYLGDLVKLQFSLRLPWVADVSQVSASVSNPNFELRRVNRHLSALESGAFVWDYELQLQLMSTEPDHQNLLLVRHQRGLLSAELTPLKINLKTPPGSKPVDGKLPDSDEGKLPRQILLSCIALVIVTGFFLGSWYLRRRIIELPLSREVDQALSALKLALPDDDEAFYKRADQILKMHVRDLWGLDTSSQSIEEMLALLPLQELEEKGLAEDLNDLLETLTQARYAGEKLGHNDKEDILTYLREFIHGSRLAFATDEVA